MNIKYFILTGALISSISYNMEAAQAQQEISQTDSIPTALVPKKYPAPQTIHITGFDTPIPFNNKTKPLFRWLENRHKNKFGNTLVVSLDTRKKIDYQALCIRDLDEKGMIGISQGRALYITNIKKADIQQKDEAPLFYGAIVLDDGFHFSAMQSKVDKEKCIHSFSNLFQAHYLANNPKK